MRLLPLSLVVLAACQPGLSLRADQPLPWETTDDGVHAPPAFDLALSGDAVAGEVADFVASGLEPLERVYFARGRAIAPGPCIPAAGGLCLDIEAPLLMGSRSADGDGVARLTAVLPDAAAGVSAALQAVVIRGPDGADSVASNAVAFTVDFAPTCDDGEHNGDEEGIDCGGPCPELCVAPPYERDEDFESGDLTAFPWELDGPSPWEITDEGCFEGDFCVRTSPYHAADEVAGLELPLSVREAGEVRFMVRTDTEDGEHVFRFWVDDALGAEVSGTTEWTEIAVPLDPTGPADDDTRLRWEYTRSAFVDPDAPARNTVWVDHIELPAFNTAPDVPRPSWPGAGVVLGSSPVLSWNGGDPDGDAVTYVVEVDDDPAFGSPESSGEIFDTTWAPELAAGLYHWRVRAKDDADHRFTAWSPARSFEVDPAWIGDPGWRQHTGTQFDAGTFDDAAVGVDTVVQEFPGFDLTSAWYEWSGSPEVMTIDLPGPIKAGTELVITGIVLAAHSVDGHYGINEGVMDGTELWSPSSWNPGYCERDERRVSNWGFGARSEDLRFELLQHYGYRMAWDRCGGDGAQFRVESAPLPGTYTSPDLVAVDLFGPDASWTRLRIDADPGVTVTVLDALGEPLPDEGVPGNGTLGAGTHLLLGVDAAAHPVLRLQATLVDGGALRSWDVTGGTSVRFDFEADAEGWTTPDGALTVVDGVLRLEADGEAVPRVERVLGVPVDATRFTSATVRLRTGNTSVLDAPSWWWSSDYGPFDARRSIVHPDVFLLGFTEVTFDLTAEPVAPDEPWQGWIDGLRVQPAEGFVDAAGLPADGWAEIDWIRLE